MEFCICLSFLHTGDWKEYLIKSYPHISFIWTSRKWVPWDSGYCGNDLCHGSHLSCFLCFSAYVNTHVPLSVMYVPTTNAAEVVVGILYWHRKKVNFVNGWLNGNRKLSLVEFPRNGFSKHSPLLGFKYYRPHYFSVPETWHCLTSQHFHCHKI